ncbi:MAG: sulfatase-like hydrolase/transferase, partial [Kiritimatiellae bacterium]|nr:sulfatase-like hydrolase/transferase [Kiritimatiellia bacterium]
MVEKFDQAVGKVLQALDDHGLQDNTLVVFSSDNGGIAAVSTQKPYRAGKGSYYEGGIREPLVMRWPSKIKAGSSSDALVCTLDLYPTFLSAARLATPANTILDGVDLMPLMTESGSIEERALYWHFPIYLQAYNPKKDDGRDPLFRTRPGSAMRFGKWKLHEYFEDGAFELYDLESDPGERNDLAANLPEKVNALKTMLFKWRTDIDAPVPKKLNPKFIN